MQKFKLPLLVASGAILVGLLLYFIFRSTSVYNAIPKSTVAIIEVKDWSQLADKLSTSVSGVELQKTYCIEKLLNQISTVQNLLGSDKGIKELIGSQNTVASIQLVSATDFDYLFTTKLAGVNDNTLLNRMQSSPLVRSVSVRIFKKQKIVDVKLANGKQLSFAKLKDIFVFSFTSFVTENSMTALLTGDNLNDDKNFKSVYAKFTSKADINFYFNFKKADVVLPIALKATKLSFLNDLKQFAGWARYEATLSNEQIELVGVATANEPKLAPNASTKAENILLGNIPDNIGYLNVPLNKQEVENNESTTNQNQLGNSYFKNWMGDSKAFAIIEPFNDDFSEQNLFIATVKDKNKALSDLRKMIADNGGSPVVTETFLLHDIYSFSNGEIINQQFGSSLVTFKNVVFTVTNNVVIFCNNSNVLKMVLDKINKHETLDKEQAFLNSGKGTIITNTGILYINTQRATFLISSLLNQNSSIQSLFSSFKSVQCFSTYNDKKIQSTIFIKTGGNTKVSTGLLWKTKLQTASNFTPQVLENNGINERQIFVQDTDFNVYLISQSGQVLFTKNVEGKVLGNVAQLDYYKNGSAQLVFNTATQIYILDRMGNDVGSYPLRLSSVANAGLVMNPQNFNYFVACNNGSIYGYQANGKPLAGWSPKNGIGILIKPLELFKVANTTYLLTLNETGKLSLFDERGTTKWSIDNMSLSPQNFSTVAYKNEFVFLNAMGNQFLEISMDGNEKIKSLIDSASCFIATPSDTGYTYFYANKSSIRSYASSGKFLNSVNINGAQISSMQVETIDSAKYIYMQDTVAKELYIFNILLKQKASYNFKESPHYLLTHLFNQSDFILLLVDNEGYLSCKRLQ